MKRYYVCKIIGDGGRTDPDDVYRPAVEDLRDKLKDGWSAVMPPSDPQTGAPLLPWCLVIVASADHTKFAHPDVDPLPDFPLDGKVNAINNATRNAVKAKLKLRGLPAALVDGWFEQSDGYRETIRGIGQHINSDFHEDRMDVKERA